VVAVDLVPREHDGHRDAHAPCSASRCPPFTRDAQVIKSLVTRSRRRDLGLVIRDIPVQPAEKADEAAVSSRPLRVAPPAMSAHQPERPDSSDRRDVHAQKEHGNLWPYL
jgi:hypothetical protein